jgi:hypothetical protein
MAGRPVPVIDGYATVNAGLRAAASGLPAGCAVTTTRDDPKLISFRWVCRSVIATATFSLTTGQRLSLSDLLTGGYAQYLEGVAATQLQAEGKSTGGVGDLAVWSLTSEDLDVTFPGGTVAFPIASLGPYINPSGPLAS